MWSSRVKHPHSVKIGVAAGFVILWILAMPRIVQSRPGADPAPQVQAQAARQKRAEFMRQKLDFSKSLLEGLALENYVAIDRNARALKTLSQAAEWEVPTIPDVENYVPLTAEFQKHADAIVKKARERDLEGTTLAYTQLIQNCVKCHKYVRERAK